MKLCSCLAVGGLDKNARLLDYVNVTMPTIAWCDMCFQNTYAKVFLSLSLLVDHNKDRKIPQNL